jgi:hypothetical protein
VTIGAAGTADLGADPVGEAGEATIQVVAFAGREAAASVVDLHPDQSVEIVAQAHGLAPVQGAVADSLVDAALQSGPAVVDRLPAMVTLAIARTVVLGRTMLR